MVFLIWSSHEPHYLQEQDKDVLALRKEGFFLVFPFYELHMKYTQ